MKRLMHLGLFVFLALLSTSGSKVSAQSYVNLLNDAELSHWMKPNGDPVHRSEDGTSGWRMEDGGILHLSGNGGNLLSREKYGDFDLWFEYRISEKGNNGIKYRVAQYNRDWLGLEYQIQDDAAFPNMSPKHLTASLYDIVAQSSPIFERDYRPLSEFNVGRIILQGNQIRHWQNGRLIIDECVGSSRWLKAVSESKFRDREHFGQNQHGHLMLTDHNSETWFRNVFIRRLDKCP
ncbi:MAG: DUF1080 domain-containing protein [Planctomyces sp.]|nr:DUF1080 domain-containing protein [Planctomyces sp.]